MWWPKINLIFDLRRTSGFFLVFGYNEYSGFEHLWTSSLEKLSLHFSGLNGFRLVSIFHFSYLDRYRYGNVVLICILWGLMILNIFMYYLLNIHLLIFHMHAYVYIQVVYSFRFWNIYIDFTGWTTLIWKSKILNCPKLKLSECQCWCTESFRFWIFI
jgi:hypothetical protein